MLLAASGRVSDDGHMQSLRPALQPRQLSDEELAELVTLTYTIEDLVEDGVDAAQAIDRFEALTGSRPEPVDFCSYSGAMSAEEFVRTACQKAVRVPDITDEELLELIRRVLAAEGQEHEIDFWLSMLRLNIPAPGISDLLFWPGEYFGDGDNSRQLSPQDILDAARDPTIGPKVISL